MLALSYMLLLKNTIETHQKLLALMVDRITPQIAVVLLQMFLLERKFYKINLNATIALKLDTRLKLPISTSLFCL